MRTKALLTLCAAGVLGACGDGRLVLKAEDLTGPWPLTVEAVELHCTAGRPDIQLEAEGKRYGLVGGLKPGVLDRREIWAVHDTNPELKRDIGELIDVAHKRCGNA